MVTSAVAEHSPTYCDTPGELPQIVFAACFCYAKQRQRGGVNGRLIHCPPDSAKSLDASQGYVTVQLSRDAKPCPVRKAQLGKQERRKSKCSFYNIGFELIILVLAGKTERKKKKKVKLACLTFPLTFWPHVSSFPQHCFPELLVAPQAPPEATAATCTPLM